MVVLQDVNTTVNKRRRDLRETSKATITMSNGHSYDTYNKWSVVPPFLASGITLLGLAVLIIVTLIRKCKLCDTWRCSQYFVDPLFRVVKVTFGDYIKKEDSEKFIFYSHEISSLQIFMLSTITIMVFWPTFMSFWASFIVNETFVCDPQLDCFLHDPSTLIVLSSEPLDNCTSYDGTNGTVVCFQFVFNLTQGFSSAVGFMSVAVVYCRLYIYVMIWCRKFCEQHEVCTMFVSLVMHTITSLIAISINIAVCKISFFSDVVFNTNKNTIIYLAYFFTYIGPFAGFYIAFVLRGARNVATSNNAQVTSEEENPLLGASVNRSNYTNIPQNSSYTHL